MTNKWTGDAHDDGAAERLRDEMPAQIAEWLRQWSECEIDRKVAVRERDEAIQTATEQALEAAQGYLERNRAEARLAASDVLLRRLVEAYSDVMAVVGAEQVGGTWSQGAALAAEVRAHLGEEAHHG